MTKVIYKNTDWETEYDYKCNESPDLTIFQIKLKRNVLKTALNKINNFISKKLKDFDNPIPISIFNDEELIIDPINTKDGCSDLTLAFKDTSTIEAFMSGSKEITVEIIKLFCEIQ